jgi:HD-GYP domain-containing protein (c-di-GMP phosphodiesterase class II)
MRRAIPPTASWAIVATLPAVAYIALRLVPEFDYPLVSPVAHFYVVSAISLAAEALAVIATFAANRLENYRALLLAFAFLAMAFLFSVHGLSTPGFLVDAQHYGVTGLTARLSVLLAAALLAASTFDPPRWFSDMVVRNRTTLIVEGAALLVTFGALALSRPESIPPPLMSETVFLRGTLILTLLLATIAALRYLDGYRHSQLPTYAALATGAVLIVQAQIAMHFSPAWYGSWWLYHIQLLLAFGAMLWAIGLEYGRGAGTVGVIQRLTLSDPILMVEAGHGDVVRSFATSLEARDRYTHGHGKRVAILAVMIGQRIGLSPNRLRALSQGALLHDVGKIAVPDAVLSKPGSLTAAEYGIIKYHPAQGAIMLGSAFRGRTELAVIRHHHEWYDGSGYPDGLAGDGIPLEARIAAVADVYDALRSRRSYRAAWPVDRAQALIRAESGTHFDPDCVDAFFEVVDRFETDFSWAVEQGEPADDDCDPVEELAEHQTHSHAA